jgi:hypothetical protein
MARPVCAPISVRLVAPLVLLRGPPRNLEAIVNTLCSSYWIRPRNLVSRFCAHPRMVSPPARASFRRVRQWRRRPLCPQINGQTVESPRCYPFFFSERDMVRAIPLASAALLAAIDVVVAKSQPHSRNSSEIPQTFNVHVFKLRSLSLLLCTTLVSLHHPTPLEFLLILPTSLRVIAV